MHIYNCAALKKKKVLFFLSSPPKASTGLYAFSLSPGRKISEEECHSSGNHGNPTFLKSVRGDAQQAKLPSSLSTNSSFLTIQF